MHLEAMEARLIPISAALVGAGAGLGDALQLIDEFRAGFERALLAGAEPQAETTPMQRFRQAAGVR